MANKNIAKGGRKQRQAKVPALNEDESRQMSDLRSQNNRLVEQICDLRKQVVQLQESKAKLERDVLQAEQVAQASAAERDFYIQNHMDSVEDCRVSSAIERMLSGTFICSQIWHHNQEREKWERGLPSYLQQVRDKQESLQGEWSMDKVYPISYGQAWNFDMASIYQDLARSWKMEKVRLDTIISSQENKIFEMVELRNATEESHKAEMEELQRTICTLQSNIFAASALDEKNKRRIAEQNLEIQELKRKVIRSNARIAEQVESRRVLSSTNEQLRKELQQTKNGFSRLSRENKELNRSNRVLKAEMGEKNIQLRSLKEEMHQIVGREADWKKKSEEATALGHQVLCYLKETAEALSISEGGEQVTAARGVTEGGRKEGVRRCVDILDAIRGAFRKKEEQAEEMTLRLENVKTEMVVAFEKKRSVSLWNTIFSMLTGAGLVLAVVFLAKWLR